MLRAMPNPRFNPHWSWVHQGIARNKERSHGRQKPGLIGGFGTLGDCWKSVLGGGSGIRTHDTVSRIHAFQACAFSHSAIPPGRGSAQYSEGASPDNRRRGAALNGWTKGVADTMIELDIGGRHRDRAQHRYLGVNAD